jgi:hypothetical protein
MLGRCIALITDNAPTHMVADADMETEQGLKATNTSRIKLVFLPANVTSIAQPLDQGIIACAKAHYRRRLFRWLLERVNAPSNEGKSLKELAPNFYQIMRWIHSAWISDVSQKTIANCWRHAGILPAAWLQDALPAVPEAPAAAAEGALAEGGDIGSNTELEMAVGGAAPVAAEAEDSTSDMLDFAPAKLRVVAQRRRLLPEGAEITSATDFLVLEGENDVSEEMPDAEIVKLVCSESTKDAGSGEDVQDQFQGPQVSAADAAVSLLQVQDSMMCYPNKFEAANVDRVEQLRGLSTMSVEGRSRQRCSRCGSDRTRSCLGALCTMQWLQLIMLDHLRRP